MLVTEPVPGRMPDLTKHLNLKHQREDMKPRVPPAISEIEINESTNRPAIQNRTQIWHEDGT